MSAHLHWAWPFAQSALVLVMIVYLLRVHRQLGRLKDARAEAQRWLTEFVQTTNRLRETFGDIKERMGRLEADLAAAEARLGQIARAEQRRGADRAWAAAVRGGPDSPPPLPDPASPPPTAAAASPPPTIATASSPRLPAAPTGQGWKAQLARLK